MKLEISHKKTEKYTKRWKLYNMLLNNEWDNKEIKEELRRYLETDENENTTTQNMWDIGKAMLREKLIALQAYLKKTRKSSNKQSNFTLKKLEKEQEGAYTLCNSMDETAEHYAKCNKPGGEGQIPYDLTFNWNIINKRKKQTKYNQRH